MQKLTRTIASFGSNLHIRISGLPESVNHEVNRLFNHGIISMSKKRDENTGTHAVPAIDADFIPGVSTSVEVRSHKTRFENGIKTLAECNVSNRLRHIKGGAPKLPKREAEAHFRELVNQEIEVLNGLFTKVETITVNRTPERVYGQVNGFGSGEGGEE